MMSYHKVLRDLAALQEGLGNLMNEHESLITERDTLVTENRRLRDRGLGKAFLASASLPVFAKQAVPALGDFNNEVEEEATNLQYQKSRDGHFISRHMGNGASLWRLSTAANSVERGKDNTLQKWTLIVSALLRSADGYGLLPCWIVEHGNISPAAQAHGAQVIDEVWTARASWMMRVGKSHFGRRTTAVMKEPREQDETAGPKCSLTIHPMSWKRALWVMLAMILMSIEAVMFSMQAYEKDPFNISRDLDIFTAVFWTLDILVSFVTGVVHSDRIELRLRVLAWRYCTTWLAFDTLLGLVQWCVVVMPGPADMPTWGHQHAPMLVRYARFARLVRFAKIEQLMSESLARLNSISVVLGVKIICTLMGLVFWVHVGGCVWYYIGNNTNEGWVHRLNLSEADLEQKYILATHWAIGQLQGGVDIYPGNPVGERVYAVGYTMFSISVLGAFVSKLTNIMFELHEIKKRRTWEVRIVCQMLSAHKISLETSLRIKAYLHWKQHVDRKREMAAKEIVQNLPTELGRVLTIEMRMPYVAPHPVFEAVRLIHERSFFKMCVNAFVPHTPILNEQIYCHGEKCSQMYFIVGGSVTYLHQGAAAQALKIIGSNGFERGAEEQVVRRDKSLCISRNMVLKEGRWLCEASLWLRWLHRGDLTTSSSASLLVLSLESFSTVASQHPVLHGALSSHARRFARTLDAISVFFATDLYDTAAAVASMQQICANELIP